MKIPLFIITDENKCSLECAFLKDDECRLFKESLTDEVLPEGIIWNNETAPGKIRCNECTYIEYLHYYKKERIIAK